MNEIIKKELLSLVLGEDIHYYELSQIDNHIAVYWNGGHTKQELNLDTLDRLYKEWLKKQEVFVSVGFGKGNRDKWHLHVTLEDEVTDKFISADSELEAVIEATEWVAKEKGLLSE